MDTGENRVALDGMEARIFKLVARTATSEQWAEWLRTPLEHALADGDKKLSLTLLKAGADGGKGWKGCNERTMLHAAAEGGNAELVRTMLDQGGLEELDAVLGDSWMTALHRVVARGRAAAARELMLAGADVTRRDARQRSALHYAVECGQLDLAGNLLIGGACPKLADASGDTPLHLAAAHEDDNFVRMLLRKGARVNVLNSHERHPLHAAVEHNNVEVAMALLKAGACVNFGAKLLPLLFVSKNATMTRTLVAHGANVNSVDEDLLTPLHSAASRGNPHVIKTLVDLGANLEARTCIIWLHGRYFERLTPLHLAAFERHPGNMYALLLEGANINADALGSTPLHLVCTSNIAESRLVKAVDLLLRWDADETMMNERGRFAGDMINANWNIKQRVRLLLTNAPADKAWRRRGMLVMCRAFPEKIQSRGARGKARAKARTGAGRGGGGSSMGSWDERGCLLARVVELEDDAVFRTVVEFL